MLTSKDLLIDIILNTPADSIWSISNDSWEKIPEVFSEYINEELDDWEITINNNNREKLIEIIYKEEIYEKVVHLQILLNNVPIFISYDCMAGSYLSDSFPNLRMLINKYKGQESEIFELIR
jgi:hypothetical protein